MRRRNAKYVATQKLRAFSKHCTLHGFYYFSQESHWIVYFIWMAVITASIALCAFLSHMIWQKFHDDPTFTVVESTHYSTTRISFPAVTVCDSELVYGPNSYNITNIFKQRGFEDYEIEEFYKSFIQIREKNYAIRDNVKHMHKMLQSLNYPMDLLTEIFAKPCDVLLFRCEWRSKLHNCTEMFRKIFTYKGFCCRFDMNHFKKNADPDTNFMPGIENTEALRIIVNGQKVSFNDTAADGYVSLHIYDEDNTITIEDSPIVVTPSAMYDVNIYLWVMESSDNVKALPLQSRKCILKSDHTKDGRFYQECMAMLILRRVVNYCRCLPFRYSAKKLQVADFAKCTWERLGCIYQTIDKVKSNIQDIVSHNECLQKCDYVQYEQEVQYVKQQRQFRNLSGTFSKITVHFNSATCLKYKRDVLYSWDQMMANLGGIFGLCLGGSIISLIELAWFILDFIYNMWKTLRNGKIGPKKKHVFIVSDKWDTKYPTHGKRYKFIH